VGKRSVRLAINCFGFTDEICSKQVVFRTFGGKLIGTAESESNPVSVSLTAAGRRALSGGRSLRVRASVVLSDPLDREQRRVGALSLRRP
jgi:hypothetical protein